ncbi:hypothetical protein NNJEOMEG_01691 [Fundidesulfovibrio magnetotacticus]|uniref:Flagellar FliJ protein n=1 Tax=Fundidesulfovibrio magnetotacticus TaxID=2730080 RepID=A0A6V8M055_9BACT|nr:flagellar export protein FliJ [Fundidesulfovibrio magnetotacticus]GFK93855.1 hypothetical protein NNJEOMEG_01691 [Fundidesulfovibrio magnetotacticus]
MTRPFRFTLAQVLDYREQLEDQAKLALAKAQQALQERLEATARLDASLREHLERMAREGASAADFWLGRNYARRLEEELAFSRLEEARLAQDVHQRRLELVERSKERKLLEKLKETQAVRHEREEHRKEQAQFDEMATLRYQPPVV